MIQVKKSEIEHETKFRLKVCYSTLVWPAELGEHKTYKTTDDK